MNSKLLDYFSIIFQISPILVFISKFYKQVLCVVLELCGNYNILKIGSGGEI